MTGATERRIFFTEREKAELLTAAREPRSLGSHEVEGNTLATLVSAGTELAVYQGLWDAVDFPIGPGYAAVFKITAVGSDVDKIEAGDIAFCMGPHCSFQRLPARDLLLVPRGLSPAEACFARLMNVTMTTLSTTTARPPGIVVVMGLGLVGHLAARIFQLCGYRVIACDPDEARRAIARDAGVETVLAAGPLDDPEIAGHAALVLECSGHEQAALDGCNLVRKRGEVVQVATPWLRNTDLYAQDLLKAVFFKYAVLRSGWEWELPHHPAHFQESHLFGNIARALEWIAGGKMPVQHLYTAVSPSGAQKAYQDLLRRKTERLAVVFDW